MTLSDLKKAELIVLAEDNQLDPSGTKAELVARLEEAGVGAEKPATEKAIPKLDVAPEEPAAPDMSGFDMDAGDTDEFLKGLYLHVLGREIDADGLAHYTRVLEFYKTQTRADILADLEASDEYKLK